MLCATLVLYVTHVINLVRVQRIEALSGGSLAPKSPTGQRANGQDANGFNSLAQLGYVAKQETGGRPVGYINLVVKRDGTGSVPSREDGTDLAATTIAFRRKR